VGAASQPGTPSSRLASMCSPTASGFDRAVALDHDAVVDPRNLAGVGYTISPGQVIYQKVGPRRATELKKRRSGAFPRADRKDFGHASNNAESNAPTAQTALSSPGAPDKLRQQSSEPRCGFQGLAEV
jgi:hypothetical protein